MTKLQVGAAIGIRTCALVICIHLYRITRLRASATSAKEQVCKISGCASIMLIIFTITETQSRDFRTPYDNRLPRSHHGTLYVVQVISLI